MKTQLKKTKPNSVYVHIVEFKDRKAINKSFTVYGETFDKVFNTVKLAVQKA